jgi:hypothetical protein
MILVILGPGLAELRAGTKRSGCWLTHMRITRVHIRTLLCLVPILAPAFGVAGAEPDSVRAWSNDSV